jgi:hypothetical protein
MLIALTISWNNNSLNTDGYVPGSVYSALQISLLLPLSFFGTVDLALIDTVFCVVTPFADFSGLGIRNQFGAHRGQCC